MEQAYKKACDILTENKDKLKLLADLLRDKEVIFREDVENIFGPRQWEDNIEGIKPKEEINDNETSTTEVTA